MNKKTILIIDDDPTVLHLLKNLLSKNHGYDVIIAHDGKSGLDLTLQERPDLILLDVMMPDISGGEVSKILKENEATRDIPIVFITVLLEAGGKKRIEFDDREYRAVSKPVYLPELLAQIRKAINEANN